MKRGSALQEVRAEAQDLKIQKRLQDTEEIVNTNDAGMRGTQEVRITYAGVIMYKRTCG